MEGNKPYVLFFMFPFIIFLVGFTILIKQNSLGLHYVDGDGVVSGNVWEEEECCQYCRDIGGLDPGRAVWVRRCTDGQHVHNWTTFDGVEWCRNCGEYPLMGVSRLERKNSSVDYCLIALISLLSTLFFSELAVTGIASGSEEKAVLWSGVIVTLLMVMIVICAASCYRSLSRKISLKYKLLVKVGDTGPVHSTKRNQSEWAMSEVLPLEELVHLKERPIWGDLVSRKSQKSRGPRFPGSEQFDIEHCFEFRRDQQFGQVVIACPETSITFASCFVSGSYGQPSAVPELNKEGVRLATFRNFPPTVPVSALRLAQVGFYYLGERDEVKCFFCEITYQGWQLGDKPAAIHARLSPNCPLVRATDTTNIPLPLPITNLPAFPSIDSGIGSIPQDPESLGQSENSGSIQATTVTDSDNSGGSQQLAISGSSYVPDSAGTRPSSSMGGSSLTSSGPRASTAQVSPAQTSSAQVAQSQASAASAAPVPSSLATPENSMFSGAPLHGPGSMIDSTAPRNLTLPTRRLDLMGAVYPLYSQHDARKRSFSTWTARPGLPAVNELVTLGFFYAGYADCVRCFFCGIGLKSWETEDVPAEVHARWRPTCEYLRLVKGDVFVDTVANGGSATNLQPQRQNAGGTGQRSDNAQPARNTTQSQQAPPASNSSNQQQGSAPSVPDIPVVRRARESGYSDQQIAEAIQKLRIIGMEAAIDAMLIEILINLFNTGTARRDGSSPNAGNNSTDDAPSARDNDMQHDGPGADANNPPAVVDGRALEERHNVLQQENARLRSMRVCQQCGERSVGVIFLPCGHIVACTVCAPSMRRCSRCDGVIRATANVFFS